MDCWSVRIRVEDPISLPVMKGMVLVTATNLSIYLSWDEKNRVVAEYGEMLLR